MGTASTSIWLFFSSASAAARSSATTATSSTSMLSSGFSTSFSSGVSFWFLPAVVSSRTVFVVRSFSSSETCSPSLMASPSSSSTWSTMSSSRIGYSFLFFMLSQCFRVAFIAAFVAIWPSAVFSSFGDVLSSLNFTFSLLHFSLMFLSFVFTPYRLPRNCISFFKFSFDSSTFWRC